MFYESLWPWGIGDICTIRVRTQLQLRRGTPRFLMPWVIPILVENNIDISVQLSDYESVRLILGRERRQ